MKSESTSKTVDHAPHKTGEFQTGKILALSIGHFVHDVYSSFLSPLLPLLIDKLSMSLTQAGFLSTIMQIPALLNPYIGILADRISVRYFVILAPALTAIPMSLIGMAPSYSILLILLFLISELFLNISRTNRIIESLLESIRYGDHNRKLQDQAAGLGFDILLIYQESKDSQQEDNVDSKRDPGGLFPVEDIKSPTHKQGNIPEIGSVLNHSQLLTSY